MATLAALSRRAFIATGVQALAGCADTPEGGASGSTATASAGTPGLGAPRVVMGAFLAPPMTSTAPPMPRLPPHLGSGAFVKFFTPAAVALQGQVLLVADPAAGRLWRMDLAFNTLIGIAGAPAGRMPGPGAGVGLALGQDESAWVLEPGSSRVLRFARDGRLLQTFRVPGLASSFALADGGASLLTADVTPAQWTEQRLVGGVAVTVRPHGADRHADQGARVGTADAMTLSGTDVLLLDRSRGAVHRVRRDGELLQTLGIGLLDQPRALVADRLGRIWVVDGFAGRLHVLWRDGRTRTLEAAALRVQQIGGLAVDDRTLALSDSLSGQVLLFPLPGATW